MPAARGGSSPSPPDLHAPLPPMRGPFYGDYSGVSWNSQAFFATECPLQEAKQHYANQIFEKRDFLGLVETHSNRGKVLAARAQPGCQSFWSHGTNRQAGVGLLIKDAFARRFNPIAPTDWVEVEPGRAAKLSMRGPAGALDIFIVYMASGSDPAVRASRRATTRMISRHMAAPEQALTIMMGRKGISRTIGGRRGMVSARAERGSSKKFS